MIIEKMQQPKPDDDKYFNEDYIRSVFEDGDRSEIEKIQRLHNLTNEQIEIFTHYAKMRKKIVDIQRKESHKRKSENLLATEDELMIACYLEEIEPQAREAVLKMNKKGYQTWYSGFNNFNSQVIKFKTEKEVNISLEKIEENHEEVGIKIKADQESIEIIFSKKISLEEITKIWNEIAEALPDLGGPVKMENDYRQKFLERQELIKSGKRKSYYK